MSCSIQRQGPRQPVNDQHLRPRGEGQEAARDAEVLGREN